MGERKFPRQTGPRNSATAVVECVQANIHAKSWTCRAREVLILPPSSPCPAALETTETRYSNFHSSSLGAEDRKSKTEGTIKTQYENMLQLESQLHGEKEVSNHKIPSWLRKKRANKMPPRPRSLRAGVADLPGPHCWGWHHWKSASCSSTRRLPLIIS